MVLFGGLNVVTAASVFRYSEAPTEVHLGMQLYDVTVDMQVLKALKCSSCLMAARAVLPAEEPFGEFACVHWNGTIHFKWFQS